MRLPASLTILLPLALLASRIEAGASDGAAAPEVTKVSTLYYGPYAFPVPDQLDGRIHYGLSAELSGDVVAGRIGGKGAADWTYAPTFRLSVPLWTDRATFSVWGGELHEFYVDTPAARAARGIPAGAYPLRGNDSGNLYFGIELQLLKERNYVPSVALRASTLSATGDDSEVARHYDAPGYFFDLSAGKSFKVGRTGDIRLSATAGFVCWQIGKGTQNDALLLGAKLAYSCGPASLAVEYGQYSGRERKPAIAQGTGSGDSPQSLKSRLDLHFGAFSPFIYVQYGLRDWPFTQFRLGLAWNFDLLGHLRENRGTKDR